MVVLVLGGLKRLRLDEYGSLEPDAVLVIDHHGKEAAVLIQFARQFRGQQRVIAFAPAPQDVVVPAEPMGRLQRRPYLCRGPREHFRARAGRGATRVARMTEYIRGAPQQLDAGCSHLFCQRLFNAPHIAVVVLDGGRRGHHVDIVEGEVRHAQARYEIERRFELLIGHGLRDDRSEPGPGQRACAKDIRAGPVERVPVTHRDLQPLRHGPAEHHAILIVDAVGKFIAGLGTFETDGFNAGKNAHLRTPERGCEGRDTAARIVRDALRAVLQVMDRAQPRAPAVAAGIPPPGIRPSPPCAPAAQRPARRQSHCPHDRSRFDSAPHSAACPNTTAAHRHRSR